METRRMHYDKKKRTKMRKINKILPLVMLLGLLMSRCATIPAKTYEGTISEWGSYKDVAKWMNSNLSYDMTRLNYTKGKGPCLVPPRTPNETFRLRSGVCYDASFFAKEVLNHINPSYKAEIVYIKNSSPEVGHFVCSFEMEGKLYIIDYGTPDRNMVGVLGPYDSLDGYKRFYEGHHPRHPIVNLIMYWRDNECAERVK
jgi:hypothetical protein